MPAKCQICEKPINYMNEEIYLGPKYRKENNIPRPGILGPIYKGHFDCIKDPQNLEPDQQAIWAVQTTMANRATLLTLSRHVARIEDALLQSTDPALIPFQDKVRHIRETYPTDQ